MKYHFSNDFASGADISWVPAMEATGFVFKDRDGNPRDIFELLKNDYGMNAIRLRSWVNPSNDPQRGGCSAQETLEMAQRAQKLGLRVMVDFHYADTWCDPKQQPKPSAWEGMSVPEMVQALYEYTRDTMKFFVDNGFTPEWVQVGNETNNGMLWPEGDMDHVENLVAFYNAGYKGIKEVSPDTIAIIHLAQGNLYPYLQEYFDKMEELGCNYDMIGLSYYPWWLNQSYKENIGELEDSMRNLIARYHKPVMVVEVGGESVQPQETYDTLNATIEKLHAVGGKGIFYWEPQGAMCFSHYPLSAWQDDGRPNYGMEAYNNIVFD